MRKRKSSFGPRTAAGACTWDTGMMLVETAKKLGEAIAIAIGMIGSPRPGAAAGLGRLIAERAKDRNLGTSRAAS